MQSLEFPKQSHLPLHSSFHLPPTPNFDLFSVFMDLIFLVPHMKWSYAIFVLLYLTYLAYFCLFSSTLWHGTFVWLSNTPHFVCPFIWLLRGCYKPWFVSFCVNSVFPFLQRIDGLFANFICNYLRHCQNSPKQLYYLYT